MTVMKPLRALVLVIFIGVISALFNPNNSPNRVSAAEPTQTATPLVVGDKRIDSHGVAQVWVPAGCFMMGSDPTKDQDAQPDEQPQHKVCLTQGYWLDQYEVTNADYQKFIDAGGYQAKQYWSDDGWIWIQSTPGPLFQGGFEQPQQPRIWIFWYEAEAYAHWRNGNLPTEAQWEYAARGPQSLIYPWGDVFDSTKLNFNGTAFATTVKVGSYPAGRSWVGADDMAGNVFEWVADWFDPNYYANSPQDDPTGPATGTYKVIRGGSWNSTSDLVRTASRYLREPVYRGSNRGMRVVSPK